MVPDAPGLAAIARLRSRWRPLLWFWLAILAVAAAGGTVLHRLGPPPERAQRDQARSGSQRSAVSAVPVQPGPPLAAAAFPAALPPPQRKAAEPPAGPRLALEPAEPAALAASPPSPVPPPPTRPSEAGQPAVRPPDPHAADKAEQDDAQPRGRVIVTLHPGGSEDGRALAGQLAAQAGLAPDQIGTGDPAGDLRSRAAVIRFYAPGDHALARRLGKELSQMGYAWRIENLSDRPSTPGQQAIEVWLPER